MIWILSALALAAPPTGIDLDGDGKREAVKIVDDGVKIGKHTLDCYSEDGAACHVREVDITTADPNKDVVLCFAGPRDIRSCQLFRLNGKELEMVSFEPYSEAEELRLTGSGFLYATSDALRLFKRTRKYAWKDGKMELVAQPIYTAPEPETLHIEKTFPLHFEPDSDALVGNALPDSDIVVLGEHGSKEGWLLVRLSSGITGWMTEATLQEVSESYMRRMQAG